MVCAIFFTTVFAVLEVLQIPVLTHEPTIYAPKSLKVTLENLNIVVPCLISFLMMYLVLRQLKVLCPCAAALS